VKEDMMASRRPQSTPKTEPTPPAVEKTAPPAKSIRARKSASKAAPLRNEISEDMRRGMIAQAAYLRAERRGFRVGDEVEDWLAAEAEVDALLKAESRGTPQ
jgi:Protein of unknown function (DUF2934)